MKRPTTLKLLPGLKWVGKLSVLEWREDGRVAVAFDAMSPQADPQERYVFDHALLSRKQLHDWTGWME